MERRTFLKLSAVTGIVAVDPLGISSSFTFAGDPPKFEPKKSKVKELEAIIDTKTGKVEANPNIFMRNSNCVACYGNCGNRVKVDSKGKILGVAGNPYNPENAEYPLGMDEPLENAYLAFSQYKDMGNKNRATVCQRGNATLDAHYDPDRILVPLKRTDKRGKGKWKPITWEEAVTETVEGGKLFSEIGEDQTIEGFRQVYDTKTLIDPKQPEFGPKSNQLVLFGGRGDGRNQIYSRFSNAFSTVNYYGHGYS